MSEKICINKEKIKEYLSPRAASIPFLIYDTAGSTNDIAKKYATENEGEAVVIALHQNAGRGRRGRSFFSPDGCGIYMSVLLRPDESAELTALMTSAAAVAVARAIEKMSGRRTDIKWINDIYIDGKKACGILCESSFSKDTQKPEYTIVGIGINLIAPNGFPEDIVDIATSVFGEALPDGDIPNRLCAEVVNELLAYSDDIADRRFISEYKKRLFVLGREVTVNTTDGAYTATATDIDDECHLIVILENGTQRILSSGDISIKL